MNRAWTAGAAACVASLLATSSCTKRLLSPADQRSPFDQYDAARGQHPPQYIEDEFGRRQPNLRARLTPRQ